MEENLIMAEEKTNLPATTSRPMAIIPQDLDGVWRLANAISKSEITPKEMKTPEKIMVAILHGMEIGMTPMQSLQRIAVINGRPTIWGDAAIGLIRASGKLEKFKEWIDGEGDEMTAHCIMKRRGDAEEVHGTFSVADAKIAGLWSPDKIVKKKEWNSDRIVDKPNDSPWHRFPKRMLQMRARAFPARDTFADVLGGLSLREEFEDQEAVDITPAKAAHLPPTLEQKEAPESTSEGANEHPPQSEKVEISLDQASAAASNSGMAGSYEEIPPPADQEPPAISRGDDHPREPIEATAADVPADVNAIAKAFKAAVKANVQDLDDLLSTWKRIVEPHYGDLAQANKDSFDALYLKYEQAFMGEDPK